jgi:membrane-associated protease RseP (regulator of RpoE activity)
MGWLAWAAGTGFAAVFALAPATAQEPDDCHCVDRDGNRVEECVCLTTPSSPNVFQIAAFGRRSMIGVTVDYEQGNEVDAEGAVIREVQPDGPAERASLQAGDIVVRVDGRSVFDPLDPLMERRLSEDQSVPVQRFVRLVGALEPGEAVEVEYLREGRRGTTTLIPDEASSLPGVSLFGDALGDLPFAFDADELAAGMDELRGRFQGDGWTTEGPGVFRFEGPGREGRVRVLGGEDFDGEPFALRFRSEPCLNGSSGQGRAWVFAGGNCFDGVEFIDLNEGLAEYFGTGEGVLVSEVDEDSSLGLRAGDVLMAIDGREVRSPEHALRILGSYEADEEVRLRVMRKGAETEVLGRRR